MSHSTIKTLEDKDWQYLLKRIDRKECTPFIGAGASFPHMPLGSELARKWSKEFKYPLSDKDYLPSVAQYLNISNADNFFAQDLIADTFPKIPFPKFDENQTHRVLADLNLPMYITTNYDDFMFKALESSSLGKKPARELCNWTKNEFGFSNHKSLYANELEYFEPSAFEPLVFHLHGFQDEPRSMVLTEDDYVDFLVNVTQDGANSILPPPVHNAMAAKSLLFIGYGLDDWNFRVLYRGLMRSVGSRNVYKSISVQLAPVSEDTNDDQKASILKYLDEYFGSDSPQIRVYWGTSSGFVKDLKKRWNKYQKEKKKNNEPV